MGVMIMDKKAYHRVYSKAYHLIHREKRNKYSKTWNLAHPEKIKEAKKKHRLAHPDRIKEARSIHYAIHKKELREKAAKKHSTHREQDKQYAKEYRLAHPEKVKKSQTKYFQTLKGKEAKRKRRAVRKQFGFIPLNKPFLNSRGHHVDREKVIHIPVELHKSIWHSVVKNINMEVINAAAFDFLHRGTNAT